MRSGMILILSIKDAYTNKEYNKSVDMDYGVARSKISIDKNNN